MIKVLTAGGFDIIHTGHIFRLKVAKAFGDYLVVNITPDNRMKRKGENRPYLSQDERWVIVSNIKGVDEVVCVPSNGEEHFQYEMKIVNFVKPDVFLTERYDKKLDDYCQKMGCKLFILEDMPGIDKKHSSDIFDSNYKMIKVVN